MFKSQVFLISLVSIFLSACSTFNSQKDETAGLLNPRKIHGAFDTKSLAFKAATIPVDDYYSSLDLARSKYTRDDKGIATAVAESDKQSIKNYVNEGIGLVEAYCRRWFQGLEDTSRLLAFENKNMNVITQLGTALLGIGQANSIIVTGYGAANTAYAGLSENFNAAFLVAPTASKVREHIDSVMITEAAKLRSNSETLSFKQAYIRLEKYADLCTHSRAKAIVDTALDLTKTQTIQGTSQVETVTK